MAIALPALLTNWDLRPDVILILLDLGALYTVGWLRLRSPRRGYQRGRVRVAAGWRLASYWSGMAVLAIALMSAVDILGGQLFFMHMIQHVLLAMIAPPLILLANPFPFMIWALPRGQWLGWLFRPQAPFRSALRQATRPGLAWLIFVAVLWGWHDPILYGAAQGNAWIHDLEHLTFFGSALLLWWHAVGAAPRIHGRFTTLARIGYLVAAAAANMLPGVIIALADRPLYPYYVSVPRIWGLTVMQDQVLSGTIMWIPGTMMYLLAALVLVIRMLNRWERQAFRESRWQPTVVEVGRT